MRELTPELERLRRAVFLLTKRTKPHCYLVEGFEAPHAVDVTDRENPTCNCPDHRFKKSRCKHILAALLRDDDLPTREQLRHLITALETP